MLPYFGTQSKLLCIDKVNLLKEIIPALVHRYLVRIVWIHTGPLTWYNSPGNPEPPQIQSSLTPLRYHIKIRDLKQGYLHSSLLDARPMLKPLCLSVWADTATEYCQGTQARGGTWKQTVMAPSAGFHLPPSSTSPLVYPWLESISPPRCQFSQWSWFRIKVQKRKLVQKKPTSTGLSFQKQPAIFGAATFKSSAWDILSAISMKAEHFQLPWKLASEVGAQHLCKPRQCFCKGKMLKLNHLQLGCAIQF